MVAQSCFNPKSGKNVKLLKKNLNLNPGPECKRNSCYLNKLNIELGFLQTATYCIQVILSIPGLEGGEVVLKYKSLTFDLKK